MVQRADTFEQHRRNTAATPPQRAAAFAQHSIAKQGDLRELPVAAATAAATPAATPCKILQHSASHCNSLQQPAPAKHRDTRELDSCVAAATAAVVKILKCQLYRLFPWCML